MKRAAIRELKRRVHAGMHEGATEDALRSARESALVLLQRSIAMKHDRLALHRLVDALRLGASVDAHARAHCTAMAGDAGRFAALCRMQTTPPARVQEMTGRP